VAFLPKSNIDARFLTRCSESLKCMLNKIIAEGTCLHTSPFNVHSSERTGERECYYSLEL
jgi:hypothetical protein